MGKRITNYDTKSLTYGLLNSIERYPELYREEYPEYYDITPVQKNYFNLFGSFNNHSSLTMSREMLFYNLETLKSIQLSAEQLFPSIAVMEWKKLLIAIDFQGRYRIHSNKSSNLNSQPKAATANLEKIMKDFRAESMMPLPTGGRNALRTISARLEIVYFYRMRIYQRLTTKEMLRRGIISVLLKAISGRHELSIFMLIPPNKDFAAYSDMRWKNGG